MHKQNLQKHAMTPMAGLREIRHTKCVEVIKETKNSRENLVDYSQ